jgi:hypothetical protein
MLITMISCPRTLSFMTNLRCLPYRSSLPCSIPIVCRSSGSEKSDDEELELHDVEVRGVNVTDRGRKE